MKTMQNIRVIPETSLQARPKSPVFLPGKNDHCLIIHFHYPEKTLLPLYDLEQMLEKEIESNRLGRFDGHGICLEDMTVSLYMFGPNARKLLRQIKHVLKKARFTKNADVYMRFGPLGSNAGESTFKLKFR